MPQADRLPTALFFSFAGLVAAFSVATVLYIREEMRGGPRQSAVLIEGAGARGAYPVVAHVRVPPEATRLRAGDLLVRVGGGGLAGAPAWSAYARMYSAAAPNGEVDVEVVRADRRIAVRETLAREPHVRRDVLVAVAFVVTTLSLLRRAPNSGAVRAFAPAAFVWALAQIDFQGAAPAQTYAYMAVRSLIGCVWAPLAVLAAVHFPEGAWPRNRRSPKWPWLFTLLGATWTGYWFSIPVSAEIALRANPILGSLTIAAILVVLTRNYRYAGPAGRRQARWVFLGCYVGLVPSLLGTLVGALRPDLEWIWFASQISLIAIPVSIYLGVTRSNLFDIDRLISGAGSYTTLVVAVGVLTVTAVPWLAARASAQTGVDTTTAQLALAGMLAFAVVKLEPILRPHVERLFFAERQVFQAGIDRLIADLHSTPDPGSLCATLGSRLDQLLHPEFSVVYARGGEGFAPVFARGCPITPHFELASSLAQELRRRVSPVDLDRDRGLTERLSAAEQAALKGLGAAVIVPIVGDRGLHAFVAIGRKASGDVFTSTDLALLGMAGGGAAGSLMRFDDDVLLRDARMLQERLRQYVPASIADQLVKGGVVESGERALSILFADLRGYSTLAEGRVAEDVFRIISRYTETVTRVVCQHGGTVVEFNGDGMMAIFGAPNPLPDKERRALAAARQIVTEVTALRGEVSGLEVTGLTVGVGLATGPAYVGAIRSVDRHIWSAIGSTTNLAARLQALTREVGAPIVIDETTRNAASEDASDFERRPHAAIRGLREFHDIYVLAGPRSAWA